MYILRSMFVISGSSLYPGFIGERFNCIYTQRHTHIVETETVGTSVASDNQCRCCSDLASLNTSGAGSGSLSAMYRGGPISQGCKYPMTPGSQTWHNQYDTRTHNYRQKHGTYTTVANCRQLQKRHASPNRK